MEYREVYQGRIIRIVTSATADRNWQFAAEVLDQPGESLKRGTAPTEQAARSAGLSAAMAAIDRSREHTGKP